MKIISVANQKGGVAKTTTAATLAHGLALKGKTTLLVDLDPQGQSSSILGLNRDSGVFNLLVAGRSLGEVIRLTGRDNLMLLPGDKSTATAQIVLDAQRKPISYLATMFKPLAKQFDYLILDTSPSIGGLQEQALYASDSVLIPTAVDYLATEGVASILDTLNLLRHDHGWVGTLFGILPTFHDGTNESRNNVSGLREIYGSSVLDEIHRATVLRECAAEGKTIWEFGPKSRSALEYAKVLYRMLEVL